MQSAWYLLCEIMQENFLLKASWEDCLEAGEGWHNA